MMRQLVVPRYGPAQSMRLNETGDVPTPPPGQVRVAVERAGMAFSDLLMREGRYPGGPVPPYTPGWDVLGLVEAVGADVDTDLIGKRVASLVYRGGYATHAMARADLTVRVPPQVAADAAACLALNYATAWQMIFREGAARAGERLLIRGAAGGVGSAALDIARASGISAWGIASPGKRDTVARLDGTWLEDRDAEQEARRIGGFDIVLDPLGGAETWRAMRLLAPGGRVVTYGFTAFPADLLPLRIAWHLAAMRMRSLLPGGRSARFFRLSKSSHSNPAAWREDMAALLELLATGKLQPVVAGLLALTEAADGHDRLQGASVEGKLLLDPTIRSR